MVHKAAGLVLWGFLVLGVLGAQTTPAPYMWDDPQFVLREGAWFPAAVDNGKSAAVFWQERKSADGWPQAYLSLMVRNLGEKGWTTRRNVLGPFTHGKPRDQKVAETQFYSVMMTPGGTYWVAVLGDEGQVILYRSDDGAVTFQEDGRLKGRGNLLVPRLFPGVDDQPVLMVTQADAATFRIASSRRTGGHWSTLNVVTDRDDQLQSFQPSVVRIGTKLALFYQSFFTGPDYSNYQIFRKDSDDGGLTWGPSVRVSDFLDDLTKNTPDEADNERPSAAWYDGRLFVAWERRTRQSQSVVELASYGSDGKRLELQTLTDPRSSARNPLFYVFQEKLRLQWFDNSAGTYAVHSTSWAPQLGWDTPERLTQEGGNSVFAQTARLGDELYFFWQNNFGEKTGLVMLGPDRHADPPSLNAVDFREGFRRNKSTFTVDVLFPRDPSGIRGYNYLLTQDPAAEPTQELKYSTREHQVRVTVPKEGRWYLAVSDSDGAWNWSTTSRIALDLKTSPPGPVLFDMPVTDSQGFLASNTFRLSWKPTTDDTVSYSWRLTRIGEVLNPGVLASLKGPEPSASPLGTDTKAGWDNLEDGVWALAVASFDEAGNRGPVTTQFFRLNKFKPYTVVQWAETKQDAFGRIEISIHGRGFLAGGAIDHVYITKEPKPPFDYDLGQGLFHVASDQLVDGIRVEGLAEGTYRIGVGHPDRGRYFTGPVLKVGPAGTVKIGDYRNLDQTNWQFFPGISVFISAHALYFWAVMTFLVLVLAWSVWLLGRVLADRRQIDRQTAGWFADKEDKWAQRAGSSAMKTKVQSLRVKFTVSILILTTTVILILAWTLGFFITENSQQTLGTALEQRTQVLLESLATGARTYLPTANYQELGNLPQQTSAMEGEALYATITGPSVEKKAGLSYIYASNDPDLKKKTDTDTLVPGTALLKDPVEAIWVKLQKELEKKAEAEVGDLARQIEDLSKKAIPLAAKGDAASQALVKQYQNTITPLQRQVSAKLAEIGGKARTYPEFDIKNLLGNQQNTYIFYQPFLYQNLGDPTYVRGLIRVEVSSEKIVKQILASRDQLILVTVVLALVALGLGLAGALYLAGQTIKPINIIVKGVKTIRDTEDKEALASHVIDPKTTDELAELALAINQMTQGLVHAAAANKDLLLGKTTQKTFIPLDTNKKGRKLTTGYLDLPEAEIFGYYEGAKGVSGDYYDFRQLDNKEGDNPQSPWYGFIKCDVSGKGIVGALIMFTVASVIVNFFRNWTAAKHAKNIQLTELVANVNDLLESLKFQGRFAALNTGILNVQTGKIRLCHAGDNVVHVWRGKTMTFETTTLPMAPATGQIADFMARGLYKHFDLTLEPGDTLLFYTDGIEESQSKFRDADFNPIAFYDPEDPSTIAAPGTRDGDRQAIDNEPLHEPSTPAQAPTPRNPQGIPSHPGNERLNEIIEAFYHRRTYTLVKKYPARASDTFTFDFSTCDGSAREVTTALVSIDRIFRLVPDPKATDQDKIKLDVIQKDFLEKHFVEYKKYFRGEGEKIAERDETKEDSEYIWFSYLKEDDQFDDLTLLAIRKK